MTRTRPAPWLLLNAGGVVTLVLAGALYVGGNGSDDVGVLPSRQVADAVQAQQPLPLEALWNLDVAATPSPSRRTPTPALIPSPSAPAPAKATTAADLTPAALALPDLGVTDVPVVPVIAPGGSLDIPEDPRVLGWWADGAQPGDASGAVVVAGHVDSARLGRGALFELRDAEPGSRVSLRTASGETVDYRVTARRTYHKRDLPSEIFLSTGPPRLVLITCGGPFDERTKHYRDNVVVFAVPEP